MPERNEKTVAVVTGGSRGIGREICLGFAKTGAVVYFNYRSSRSDAAETESLAAESGGIAKGICADIACETGANVLFDQIFAEAGRVDILVNNAGITKNKLIVRMNESEWDEILDTNLKGAFFCTKAAAKAMLKQKKGRIINISSVVGVTGNPGQSGYSASKAGLIGFTKSVARELAPRNITVNAVAPGFIETDMTGSIPEKEKEKILAGIPAGRTGKPQDVAAVVLFLASDEAEYITGQVIHVNGGMYT